MTLRDFMPPAFAKAWDSVVARSLAAYTAAFMRGDDVTDRPAATRLVSAYGQSPMVFAAVNMISGEFAGLDLDFYQGEEAYGDAQLDAWWTAPALGTDRKRINRDLVDRILTMWLKNEGEYFLLLDDSWVTSGGRPLGAKATPFIIARPDRMRLIVQGGELQGYEWIDAGGRRHVFVPEQVIHHKEPNPFDDWRGLGCATVARVAIEGVFLTGNYIRELMRNNGDQGFIVIGKNGVASDDQRAQIVADLRAKRLALRMGQPKDLFLTGDITVDRPTEQAAGADLVATTGMSGAEIFLTYGVPPSMGTVKQSYSIGKDSDRYQLITGTSLPTSRTLCGSYAKLASMQSGKTLTAEHDWDEHPVMQEVRNARIDTGVKLWTAGWSWEDINDYLSLGAAEFPGWDKRYLPFSVSEVDSGAAPEEDPALVEDSTPVADNDQVKALRALVLLRQRMCTRVEKNVTPLPVATVKTRDPLAACQCGAGLLDILQSDYVEQKADRDPKEIALWKQHMAVRREQVKGFASRFSRSLMKARTETLRNIESKYISKGVQLFTQDGPNPVHRTAAADLMFDLADFAADFQAGMRKQHKLALDAAGQQVMSELGKKNDPFTFAPGDVLDFISGRTNKLSGVPDDVFSRIQKTMQEGIDAGESKDDLASRVRAEFNAIDKGRSQVIAQTETSAAFGYGRNAAMEDAGVEYKAWLTSGNDNVRLAHQEAGLTYAADAGIPLDDPFIVDGEELQYPGDASGSPENVINCHCIQIAVGAPA